MYITPPALQQHETDGSVQSKINPGPDSAVHTGMYHLDRY